jgi:hypothetical protein
MRGNDNKYVENAFLDVDHFDTKDVLKFEIAVSHNGFVSLNGAPIGKLDDTRHALARIAGMQRVMNQCLEHFFIHEVGALKAKETA